MSAKLFITVMCFFGTLRLSFTALNDEESGTKHIEIDESSYKILPLIYVKKDDHYHHPTHLLKKILAKDGQSFSSGTIFTYKDSRDQVFFCPPETDAYEKEIQTALNLYEEYSRFKEYSKDLIFSKYCQFEHTFEIKEPMTCSTEANPVLRKITHKIRGDEMQDDLCGREEEGKLYEFFYMACPKFGLWKKLKEAWNTRDEEYRRFLFGLPFIAVKRNAYQFCYDHNKMETMYAKYRLIPAKLFFYKDMKFEYNKDFPFRTEGYEYFDKDFEKIKRAYDQVVDPEDEKLYFNDPGPSTPNILNDVPQYTFHQLVPAIHFPLAIWKKCTFHYANVRPMHRNLINLWDLIDHIILYDSYKRDIPFEIYTGAFNVPDTNRPIQYVYKDHVQIPEIWVKIIHNSNHKESYLNEGVAITMKNYELTVAEDSIPELVSDCPENLCFSFLSQEEILEKFPFAAYQICCLKITKEILDFFQINLQSPYLLKIDPLIG